MKINISNIEASCIWLGIALSCFVNSVGMNINGKGFSGSIIPLTIGCGIFWIRALKTNGFRLYKDNSWLMMFFMLWILEAVASTVLNFYDVIYAENLSTTGGEQFVYKLLTLLLYLAITVYAFFTLCCYDLYKIYHKFNKALMVSFAIASLYAFFEILSMFDETFLHIVRSIDVFFRGSYTDELWWKVRSTTYEPSTLGNYLAFAAPFLFVKAISGYKKYWLMIGFMIIMAFMSYSRTVYVIVLAELILVCILCKSKNIILYTCGFFAVFIFVLQLIAADTWFGDISLWDTLSTLWDMEDTSRLNSNAMRYGSQVASYNLWFDNIIFGVGLGQAKFHVINYVPDWIWQSSDIYSFQYDMPFFGVYPRMLADQGLLGLMIYLLMWFVGIYKLYKKRSDKMRGENNQFIIAVIVAMLGTLLADNNWDILSYPVHWILLALVWRMTDKGSIYVKNSLKIHSYPK